VHLKNIHWFGIGKSPILRNVMIDILHLGLVIVIVTGKSMIL
jgi:hypothetical protein